MKWAVKPRNVIVASGHLTQVCVSVCVCVFVCVSVTELGTLVPICLAFIGALHTHTQQHIHLNIHTQIYIVHTHFLTHYLSGRKILF